MAERPAGTEHGAFYRFVAVDEPQAMMVWLRTLATRLELLGSIVVAPEGVNGAVAGPIDAIDAFEAGLSEDTRLAGLRLQRSGCVTPPFRRLRLRCKKELVGWRPPPSEEAMTIAAGLARLAASASATVSTGPITGTSVAPLAWRRLILEPDVVLLDNRNAFEYRLGHFRDAVHPDVGRFHDFPSYVEHHAAGWKAAGKRVAMYCTGGIRCEKSTAWMQGLGLTVHRLEGGILNYFREMGDRATDWQGECFVFDNRIAVDTGLQETATTAEEVYAGEPEGEWRLDRARRLDAAAS